MSYHTLQTCYYTVHYRTFLFVLINSDAATNKCVLCEIEMYII